VGGEMAKIINDQYFTSPEVAEHCFKKTLEVIGEENITEFIESSSGEGIFIDMIEKFTPNIPYQAYDIDVKDSRVIEQDFLKLDLEYKKGRCVGFNPPFGRGNTLSVQFYKKSIIIGDYICFILPISQLNNNIELYDFNLIYSEDLGIKNYSNISLHCVFNIYKKPEKENKKSHLKLKDILIKEFRRGRKSTYEASKFENFNYDIRIVSYGSPLGKIVIEPEANVKEFCIKINKKELKSKVIEVLKTTVWENIYNIISSPNLSQWQVYKYLKEQIPELE
jgi:hypothetical protein